ncbi:hypothetical protein OESDEN_00856 [Oesophagostomum dentatum]|uniref:Reverse transcriptase domain-containing protein n=1 Tax=Oesophagostomum dentatum TaxID=61180 RepID=A0A0B1TNR6_OESDE|nr:hypothetical protein OESDEN_00856 [Oesophagostomum dentatum]
MLMINTHHGLYRYNRLTFEVKSAPGIFQQIMDAVIAILDGVAAYLDDIIITGRTNDHRRNLEALLERGFCVLIEKCHFMTSETRYLGDIIERNGRLPDPQDPCNNRDASVQGRSSVSLVIGYGQLLWCVLRTCVNFAPLLTHY